MLPNITCLDCGLQVSLSGPQMGDLVMIYSLQNEILKKAKKTRAYLNQSSCSFAIWEVQEAAKHLWPNLSDAFLKKIESKVTDLDAEIYRKASSSSLAFDELPGFYDF